MKISEKGLALIKQFEGLRLHAYLCAAGVPTIGYGHTKGVEMDDAITEEQAEHLLQEDLREFELAIQRLVHISITQNQFDALVSLVFNIGVDNFKKSTLLKKVNARDTSGAANEFNKWVFAGKKKLEGLVKRRNAERLLFIS